MPVTIPDCPPSLKSIQHYLKTASEHDARDPVVAYWCRLHALQVGMKLTNKKTPEETKMLMGLMDWLEEEKTTHKDNEAISNEVAAQAHLENYALKLFMYADKQDREQNYGKNVVKAFYTSGMIYDVLTTFGELTDEAAQNRKYAKWKAAYIHNCLKNGETPVPGPLPAEGETPNDENSGINNQPEPMGFTPNPGFQPEPTGFAQNPGFNPQVTPATPPIIPTSFSSTLPDPNAALRAASQLPPVPYTPDPNPGGFVPYDPSQQSQPSQPLYGDNSLMVAQLSPDQIAKAQKYCKWASSALNYDDVKTAINNLKNALELLQTGRDPA
ncbi:PREDICTED: vacuolar protein sorting-associated protein VTA1 homolog [Papilio polytes]|uniref:vacuolar protein sorting-associated protein VTA1 homolog n=1 Tax=Papilio polytes TaxID=76194 RepID=UPI000675DAC8|nr:PREDICTED: vacuolar protein sorting-associated protein VTA1 homolog [Papilio polytes]XP_013134304.1 PREDICTED: vacuolar protein sorting-associated protein VTA1 homolog [Papilio polytes]